MRLVVGPSVALVLILPAATFRATGHFSVAGPAGVRSIISAALRTAAHYVATIAAPELALLGAAALLAL